MSKAKGHKRSTDRTNAAFGAVAHTKRRESVAQEMWRQARSLARPLIAYWLFLFAMFGAFAVAAIIDSPTPDGLWVLFCLGMVTFTSVFAGQILALLRVRDWLLYATWGFTWLSGFTLGCMGAIAISAAAPPLAILLFCYIFFGPMFLLGGAWSLRTGRALFACWVPVIYASGTAIIMAERRGAVSEWMAGSKWAIWDVFTFSVLGVGIVLLLAYLVSREVHRLHLWRNSKRGLLQGSVKEKGKARPRLSCMGWLMLAMLAGALSVGTALVAPYLWRTGPAEEGDQSDNTEGQDKDGQQGQGSGQTPQDAKDQAQEKVEDVVQEVQENLQPAAQQGIDLLSTLITLLLMLLAAWLLGYRPIKRLLLVRHLRRPFWTQPATRRIEFGWQLVEVALEDAGVRPRPNEPAVSLYQRALPTLQKLSAGAVEVHGLAQAAQVRDRIAYGLGVGLEDVELMDRAACWAYDTVWDRLGDRGQIKAMYRGL